EVLKHLQGKLEQEARVMVSSGQTEVLDQLKGACWAGWGGRGPCQAHPDTARGAGQRPPAPASHRDGPGELGRATFRMLEELDRER
ncbi:APCL protein, partial [Ifrita kowaldi]|nr:APCL protein [Ifrita kowaldi]